LNSSPNQVPPPSKFASMVFLKLVALNPTLPQPGISRPCKCKPQSTSQTPTEAKHASTTLPSRIPIQGHFSRVLAESLEGNTITITTNPVRFCHKVGTLKRKEERMSTGDQTQRIAIQNCFIPPGFSLRNGIRTHRTSQTQESG